MCHLDHGEGFDICLQAVEAGFSSVMYDGSALPLAMVPLSPAATLSWTVSIAALLFLAILGGVGAKAGGAPMGKAIFRVTFWGAIAMAATAAIGSLFGTTIA